MTRQTGIALVAAFVLGIAVTSFLDRPTVAQAPVTQVLTRYTSSVGGGTSQYALVTDVTTGETWIRNLSGTPANWAALGSPRIEAAKTP